MKMLFNLASLLVVFIVLLASPAAADEKPEIIVVTPKDGEMVKSPVDLDIRFVPSADASIDPASLKVEVEKPLMNIDITEKVAPFVTEEGIMAEGAPLPSGEHTIKLSVADDKGRATSTTTSITVTR
jgi:hypothetical protein